jgi:dTDP-4-dehydrorhamnose reductase
VAAAARDEWRTFATYNGHRFDLQGVEEMCLDVTDYQQVHAIVRALRPKAVIYCAGITDLNYCEKNRDAAFSVNAGGARNVAKSLGDTGKMILVSCAHIFNGHKQGPYTEEDEPAPLSIYGESILAAEHAVRDHCPDFIIARTSALWGLDLVAGRPNPVSHMLKEMLGGRAVELSSKDKISPTYVNQASEILLELLRFDLRGVFNVASQDCMSPRDMGLKVADFFNCDQKLVEAADPAGTPHGAQVPAHLCLDGGKTEEAVGRPLFSFDEALVFFRSEVQNYLFDWGRPQREKS